MQTAIVPGIYDPTIANHDLQVSTDDADAMTRRLAAEEGLLVGISAARRFRRTVTRRGRGPRPDPKH
jgi:cysteine synthase